MSEFMRWLPAEERERITADVEKIGGTLGMWTARIDGRNEDTTTGAMIFYTNVHGDPSVWLYPDGLRDPHRAVYVVDDGQTAVPHYVTGWDSKEPERRVLLQPYPVNPNGKRRANGEVIDYRGWMLPPSRGYHLNITRVGTP